MNIFVINLPNAIDRRIFQQQQLDKLGLDYEILSAVSTNDINDETYQKHANDWQRPLRKSEVACYYSHQNAWNRVIDSNQPALILEDDALLSKCVPELLNELVNKQDVDLINFENRGRKKFISRFGETLKCRSKLFRLYQDRTGASGYVLYPNGAKKLIQHQQKKGIALADAHITDCHTIKAYQVEPTPIIQLDMCHYYGIDIAHLEKISTSTVSARNNPKGGFYFRVKRGFFQLKLGLRQLMIIIKSDRRYIKIKVKNYE